MQLFVTQLAKKEPHSNTPDPSQTDHFFSLHPFPFTPNYKSPDREDEKYQLFYKSTEFNMKLVRGRHSRHLISQQSSNSFFPCLRLGTKLSELLFSSLLSPLFWPSLPLLLPATSRNTKPQLTLSLPTLPQATPPRLTLPRLTLPRRTPRITNTLASPSPANLMSAISTAAASGGKSRQNTNSTLFN
jgi:hypothetical protein